MQKNVAKYTNKITYLKPESEIKEKSLPTMGFFHLL